MVISHNYVNVYQRVYLMLNINDIEDVYMGKLAIYDHIMSINASCII